MKTVVGFQQAEKADPSAWVVAIATDQSREAFALLFDRFAPRVKSYLLKLGTKGELAEELAQETLLVVWRKAAYFDPSRASASTWIFTIARNLRIDALRRELDAAGARHQVTIFNDVQHSFTDPDAGKMGRPGIAYDVTADRVSWAGTVALLETVFA